MKLTEILNSNHYTVYVDLDGVLADFMKKAKEVTGIDLDKADNQETTEFFKELDKRARAGKKFFEYMDLLPDAMVLWNHIKKYDPIILSSTGHTLGAAEEKRAWVKKHLGYEAAKRALFVRQSREKSKYANSHSILIDDRAKSIDPWVAADGIGILHVSAAKTIKELKKLGL